MCRYRGTEREGTYEGIRRVATPILETKPAVLPGKLWRAVTQVSPVPAMPATNCMGP